MGPLIPLFWTSDEVWPGFQSLGGFPHLHDSSPVCNRFLRFTYGAIPADLLAASIATQLFRPGICTGIKALYLSKMSTFISKIDVAENLERSTSSDLTGLSLTYRMITFDEIHERWEIC